MKRIARLLFVPVGLTLATLAFANAASESGWLPFGSGFFGRTGIDAHAVGEVVNRDFRMQTAAAREDTLGELDPEQVAALAKDPAALEQFLEARSTAVSIASEFPKVSDELLTLARLAYAADPLNVPTLRTIALGQVVHHDVERARRIMRLAERLSKRDDITNFWLAQDYGQLGDVENMLASFDHALRTSRRVREGAMEPVVTLMASEESHAALGRLLKQRPDWEDSFWREFSHNPAALANADTFFANSGLSIESIPERFRRTLYANLKRGGQFDVLYRLSALDPEAGADALHAGKVIAADDVNPLGWDMRSRGDFGARLHEAAGELQIDARAGAFGVAADRLVRLDGDYALTIQMAEPLPESVNLELSVICLDPNDIELAAISLKEGSKAGEVSFSAGSCKFANLEVSFGVNPGRRAALIRIASISLRPG